MELWRRRPGAQQLGKLWPPSQPADNFEPPACVRACVRARGAAEERPRKTTSSTGDREDRGEPQTRPFSSPGIHIWGKWRSGRNREEGKRASAALFSTSPSEERRLAASPRRKLWKLLVETTRKASKKKKPKGIQLVELALSLHVAAGECALKFTWLFKWKKKRNPLAGEEFALKTDTSFSRSAILQPQGTQRVPAEGGWGGGKDTAVQQPLTALIIMIMIITIEWTIPPTWAGFFFFQIYEQNLLCFVQI